MAKGNKKAVAKAEKAVGKVDKEITKEKKKKKDRKSKDVDADVVVTASVSEPAASVEDSTMASPKKRKSVDGGEKKSKKRKSTAGDAEEAAEVPPAEVKEVRCNNADKRRRRSLPPHSGDCAARKSTHCCTYHVFLRFMKPVGAAVRRLGVQACSLSCMRPRPVQQAGTSPCDAFSA